MASIDDQFGEGFAKANPAIACKMAEIASSHHNTLKSIAAQQDLSEELQRYIDGVVTLVTGKFKI